MYKEKKVYSYLGLVAGAYPLLAFARETSISANKRSELATEKNLKRQKYDGERSSYVKAYEKVNYQYGLGIMFFTIPLFKLSF